ncbi:MAG: hypothetical protein M1831_003015 [Alyxoria varia]|nr:MAG: hypothetical protein M1831_003015 [Alyxoria varia]
MAEREDDPPVDGKPRVLLLGELDHHINVQPIHLEEKNPAHNAHPSTQHHSNTPSLPPPSSTQFWHDHIDPIAHTLKPHSTDRRTFLRELQSPRLTNLHAIYRTFSSATLTGPIDADLTAALPSSLQLIAHNGAGYDQLHVPSLTSRGILATNTPGAVDDSTADTALFLLLGCLRNFNTSMAALRRGEWRGAPEPPALGHDPRGKLLGVLGMGGIGGNLARKCTALGMRVAYHNRRRLSGEEEEVGPRGERAVYMGFEELLGCCDVLSVHVPLGEKTRHLLSYRELGECLKPGAIVINTARGAVVDEEALVQALESGRVGAAGLDVYEREPQVHEGLRKEEARCLLLPHMGTWTVETQKAMEEVCIGNVEGVVKGGKEGFRGLTVVPEQRELWERKIKEAEEGEGGK